MAYRGINRDGSDVEIGRLRITPTEIAIRQRRDVQALPIIRRVVPEGHDRDKCVCRYVPFFSQEISVLRRHVLAAVHHMWYPSYSLGR